MFAVSTLEKQATLSPHNEKLSTEAATSTSGKHEHIKHDHSTSLPHEEKPSSEMKTKCNGHECHLEKQGTEESESAETFKQKVPDHHEDQYENMAPGGEAPDVEKPGGGKFQKIKSMLSSKTSNSGDSENDESSGKGMFPMSLIKKGFKKDKKEGEEAKNEAGVESPSTTIAPEEEDEDTSETTIDGDEMETATNATINGTKVNE
uniref:Uncharacterized protein n=1 Tax=Romanomermis culicivorax TaxID=13658 RepID=A0A915HS48_ROMCU